MAGHRVINDIAFAGISPQPTKPNFIAVPFVRILFILPTNILLVTQVPRDQS